MYGICQNHEKCTNKATHQVQFRLQPRDPMMVCASCARKHRKPGNDIRKVA